MTKFISDLLLYAFGLCMFVGFLSLITAAVFDGMIRTVAQIGIFGLPLGMMICVLTPKKYQ